MAQIQSYEATALPTGGINTQATPDDFGAQVGRGDQMVGQGASQIGETLYKLDQDAGYIQATTDVNKAADGARTWFSQKMSAMDPTAPDYLQQLHNLEPQYQQQLKDTQQQYLDANPNRAYQRMFAVHMARYADGLARESHVQIANATGEYMGFQINNGIKTDLDSIAKAPDPASADTIVQARIDSITSMRQDGFGPMQKLKLIEQFKNQAGYQQYSALANNNPYRLYQALGFQGGTIGKTGPKLGLATGGDGTAATAVTSGVPASGFQTPTVAPAVQQYSGQIKTFGMKYGVDPNFLMAQINVESRGNAAAISGPTATGSPSIGIAQFQQATAAQYGVNPKDPTSSLEGQAHYMSDLLKQFGGDYTKATAAYNWGPRNLSKAVSQFGDNWQQHLPPETTKYLGNIFGSLGATSGAPSAPGQAPNLSLAQGQAMPTPQPLTDNQIATADVKAGSGFDGWQYLSSAQKIAVGRTAEQNIRADMVAQQQSAANADKQLKAQQDSTMNGMLDKMIDGKLTVQDVRNDRTLTFSQREQVLNGLNSQSNKIDKTDPGMFSAVFDRIHAPDGDPNKITDPDDLNKYMGQGIGFADLQKLRGELAGKGTPEIEQKKDFLTQAKGMISGSSMIAKDPEGDRQYYNFQAAFQQKYDAAKKAGKDWTTLLDPSSKDYMGTMINQYIRSPQQQITDQARRMAGGASMPQGAAVVMPVRKQGESVAAYLNRTGAK